MPLTASDTCWSSTQVQRDWRLQHYTTLYCYCLDTADIDTDIDTDTDSQPLLVLLFIYHSVSPTPPSLCFKHTPSLPPALSVFWLPLTPQLLSPPLQHTLTLHHFLSHLRLSPPHPHPFLPLPVIPFLSPVCPLPFSSSPLSFLTFLSPVPSLSSLRIRQH